MTMSIDVLFYDGQIRFPDGHLSRIGRSFDGTLTAAAVKDADPAAAPPEIRTTFEETLFVSAVQRTELERFCQTYSIPTRRRPDVWGDLLEPFVDTEYTPEHQAATVARLRQAGLADADVDAIRARVGPLMVAYNAFHWDWAYLGLFDLLKAATSDRYPENLRLDLGDITRFYWWAMTIANPEAHGPLET